MIYLLCSHNHWYTWSLFHMNSSVDVLNSDFTDFTKEQQIQNPVFHHCTMQWDTMLHYLQWNLLKWKNLIQFKLSHINNIYIYTKKMYNIIEKWYNINDECVCNQASKADSYCFATVLYTHDNTQKLNFVAIYLLSDAIFIHYYHRLYIL